MGEDWPLVRASPLQIPLFLFVITTCRMGSQRPVRTTRTCWSWHALWSCFQKLFVAFLHAQRDCLQNFVVYSGTSLTWMYLETTLAWTMPKSGMNSQCVGCSLCCVGGSQWSCCGRTETQMPGFSPQHKTLVSHLQLMSMLEDVIPSDQAYMILWQSIFDNPIWSNTQEEESTWHGTS